jgi:hypothetical protein
MMTGYKVVSIGLKCGVNYIGVMTGYMLGSIRFELWCVSDLCYDSLQAGQGYGAVPGSQLYENGHVCRCRIGHTCTHIAHQASLPTLPTLEAA